MGWLVFGRLDAYRQAICATAQCLLIPAELIQAGRETLRLGVRKRIKLILNKEELPHQWKESTVVPIHKKSDKTDCSNYRDKSFL
jgi:hypothetical protein